MLRSVRLVPSWPPLLLLIPVASDNVESRTVFSSSLSPWVVSKLHICSALFFAIGRPSSSLVLVLSWTMSCSCRIHTLFFGPQNNNILLNLCYFDISCLQSPHQLLSVKSQLNCNRIHLPKGATHYLFVSVFTCWRIYTYRTTSLYAILITWDNTIPPLGRTAVSIVWIDTVEVRFRQQKTIRIRKNILVWLKINRLKM